MTTRLTEFPDRRVWDLSGFTLDRICLDYQVRLLIANANSSVNIIIETSLTLRVGARREQIDPEHVLTTAPLLPLLHQPAASLAAFRDGRLRLKFEQGAEVEALKDEQYESWETHGDGELDDINMSVTPHEGPPWYEPVS